MAVDVAQQQDEFARLWNKIVARSVTDAAFKQRLLAEPSTVLAEHGVELPADVEVRVHEGPWTTVNLTLPSGPRDDLADAELVFISGGGMVTCSSVCCTTYTAFCACDPSKCRR